VVTAADPVATRQSRAARPERMLRVREGMFIRIFVQVGAAVSAVTIGVSGSAARGRKPNVETRKRKKRRWGGPAGFFRSRARWIRYTVTGRSLWMGRTM
jgi:hypothetical protein